VQFFLPHVSPVSSVLVLPLSKRNPQFGKRVEHGGTTIYGASTGENSDFFQLKVRISYSYGFTLKEVHQNPENFRINMDEPTNKPQRLDINHPEMCFIPAKMLDPRPKLGF
jgi:hypothetical protein